MAERIL